MLSGVVPKIHMIANANIKQTLLTLAQQFLRGVLAAPKQGIKRTKKLPQSFSWKGSGLIQSAKAQYACGSCWAVATAGMFSDIVSIATGGKVKPDISATYLLSCFPQDACAGGIPGDAVKDIVNHGIVYTDCVDYSWCKRNKRCSDPAYDHFENSADYLNSKIPPCLTCKKSQGVASEKLLERECETDELSYVRCLQGGGKVYKYFGKNPYAIYAETDDEGKVIGKQLEQTIYDMKEHVSTKGPIMGSYYVLTNFINEGYGKFKETDGVYLENYYYTDSYTKKPCVADNDNSDKLNTTPFNIAGGHAVVLVGYGVQKINAINLETGKPYGMVPYWEVRNSWGSAWGDDGFFKMAMYPVNKFAQFEVGLKYGNIYYGGTCLVDYKGRQKAKVVEEAIVFENDINDDDSFPIPTDRMKDELFKDNTEIVDKGFEIEYEKEETVTLTNTQRLIATVGLSLFVIAVVWSLIKLYKKMYGGRTNATLSAPDSQTPEGLSQIPSHTIGNGQGYTYT